MNIVPQKKLKHLFRLYEDKKFAELQVASAAAIDLYPGAIQLWNLLAVAYSKSGNLVEAEETYLRALSLDSKNAELHNNLGVIQEERGNQKSAFVSYSAAVELSPNYVHAIINLGHLCSVTERLDQSEKLLRKAIHLDDSNAQAFSNLGSLLVKRERFEEAVSSCQQAIELAPRFSEAHNNLGTAKLRLGQREVAIESFKEAINLKPEYPDAIFNLGMCLYDEGNLIASLKRLQTAVFMRPTFFEAYLGLGNVLKKLGRAEEALQNYRKALGLNRDSAVCWYSLAQALKDEGTIEPAIDACQRAMALKSNYCAAQTLKMHLLARNCDWDAIDLENRNLIQPHATSEVVPPFTTLAFADDPSEEMRRATLYASRKFGDIVPSVLRRKSSNERKMTLAYFSADFGNHPIWRLLARVFELHDRSRYTVIGFSNMRITDRSHLRRLDHIFDRVYDISSANDNQACEIARDECIDIAVDLSGYTKGSRSALFAKRIAPIQVNYLGFPGTMGAEFMDYIIADRVLIPPEKKKYFTEKVVYLPNCFQAQDNTVEVITDSVSRDLFGLPPDGFVFCCFNNNYKITRREFAIWMLLLEKIPDSVIWILKTNNLMVVNLKKEAEKKGIDSQRLIMTSGTSYSEYLARLTLADLYLDTFNYNAGATASDVIRAGLPILTLQGLSYTARMASSLLEAIGLSELIVDTEEAFLNVALELATDQGKLSQIRKRLSVNMKSSPLFDTEKFTVDLEGVYENMVSS